jgi:hypothetical protein
MWSKAVNVKLLHISLARLRVWHSGKIYAKWLREFNDLPTRSFFLRACEKNYLLGPGDKVQVTTKQTF